MKKKVPLQVHEFMEPYLDKKGENFQSIEPDGFMLRFIDSDPDSDFYFNIEQYKLDREFQLLVDFKPLNKQSLTNRRTWIKAQDLQSNFSNWLKLLEGYDNVKTIFDDPIVKSFADEYYDEFELIDEDADKVPLNPKQIILLDEHLELIEKGIEKHITQENVLEIKLIQEGIVDLKDNLTKKSKKWVFKKLSKIWGQIAKQGVPLIKEFLTEVRKEFIKQGVKQLLNGGN
jgi:hypothetical protein